MNQIILNRLLRHFRLDNEDYSELERQQVEYVYNRMCEQVGADFKDILDALEALEAAICSRVVHHVYYRLKTDHMTAAGRYDYSTLKPPLDMHGYDKGWRL